MRTLLVFMAMLVAGALRGQTSVRVLHLSEAAETARVLHVWGGGAVELALEVTGTDPAQRINLRGNVYQLAGAVAAPLNLNLPIAQELSFDHSRSRRESWKLSLPAVRNITSLEVRFAAQADAGAGWRPAGSVRLIVYPAGLGAQLKDLVMAAEKSGAGRIAVFGKSPELKSALESVSIPFHDVGETPPEELDSSCVYLGQASPAEIDSIAVGARSHGRLILFTNDPIPLPGVYRTNYSSGFLIKVTLPLLQDFAHSPQRQSALLNLLQHTLQNANPAP